MPVETLNSQSVSGNDNLLTKKWRETFAKNVFYCRGNCEFFTYGESDFFPAEIRQ